MEKNETNNRKFEGQIVILLIFGCAHLFFFFFWLQWKPELTHILHLYVCLKVHSPKRWQAIWWKMGINLIFKISINIYLFWGQWAFDILNYGDNFKIIPLFMHRYIYIYVLGVSWPSKNTSSLCIILVFITFPIGNALAELFATWPLVFIQVFFTALPLPEVSYLGLGSQAASAIRKWSCIFLEQPIALQLTFWCDRYFPLF